MAVSPIPNRPRFLPLTAQESSPSFVLRAVQHVAFEDRPVPPLHDPWAVRVQISQTGICASDVHYWQRGRIGGWSGCCVSPSRRLTTAQTSFSSLP